MTGKLLFSPVPPRSMADDLSGLVQRVLTCVSMHDRMSLATGKGQGCRAGNQRMAELVGCDYSRLCAALSTLVGKGYLTRAKEGKFTVYRVIYNDDDLRFGKSPRTRDPDQGLRHGKSVTCHPAKTSEPIACRAAAETHANPPKTAPQYIPRSGGIDFEESREDSSVETARLAARVDWPEDLSDHAKLAIVERQLRRAPDAYSRAQWASILAAVDEIGHNAGYNDGAGVNGKALRIAEEIDLLLSEPVAPPKRACQ